MSNDAQTAEKAIKKDALVLHVRYLGSRKQYVDPQASAAATLTATKLVVLQFFELQETSGKTYFFSLNGTVLTDPSLTLGQLAEGKHELKLDLVEQLIQG